MQIVLAHPAPTPFVQQVGLALFEAGMLNQFATTLVDRPDATYLNYLSQLSKLFKFDLKRQLSSRTVNEFPLSLVQNYPWLELCRLLVGRIDKDKRLTDIVFHWGVYGFDNWVAQQISSSADAIYGYEYNSLAAFKLAHKKGIARIYEVPSPEHDFMNNMIQREVDIYPEIHTPYQKYVKARQKQRTQRRREEWQLADVAIANSQFTKESYAAAGLDVSKMRVIPLGAPPVCLEGIYGGSQDTEPIRFLWAGNFAIHKGAHYLLAAWKILNPGAEACIDIFGSQRLPSPLIENLPSSINFLGAVPRFELYNHYQTADVLVFPTLGDGFGMVVSEAFAHGLPVITTNRAGASDLVRHGVNGLIIPPGDEQALAEALDWCITHRQELKAMRKAALETAANWQWSDYRQALINNLIDGIKTAGYRV